MFRPLETAVIFFDFIFVQSLVSMMEIFKASYTFAPYVQPLVILAQLVVHFSLSKMTGESLVVHCVHLLFV